MPLTLPSLDDRRWADLVDEARTLIPVYAPEWTDHNTHDPGITLIDLLAWLAEGDIYRVDRVPEAHRRRFLALMGFRLTAATPARGRVAIRLRPESAPLTLPAGVGLASSGRDDPPVPFRTTEAATLVAGSIAGVFVGEGGVLTDHTATWESHEPLTPFGADPRAGDAFHIGFAFPSGAVPGDPVSLTFVIDGADREERARLQTMLADRGRVCDPQRPNPCLSATIASPKRGDGDEPPLRHHDVRLTWEVQIGGDIWEPLDDAAVEDTARAFSLSGCVRLRLPAAATPLPLTEIGRALTFVRCRIVGGAYDQAPVITAFDMGGIAVEQAALPSVVDLAIAADAVIEGPVPAAGCLERIAIAVDAAGPVARLRFGADGAPHLFVVDYRPPAGGADGAIRLAARRLGTGTGLPLQTVDLEPAPPTAYIAAETLTVFTITTEGTTVWTPTADLLGAGRTDAACRVDWSRGRISFGDGERGQVVPRGAGIFAAALTTLGAEGNVAETTGLRPADTPLDRALFASDALLRIERIEWLQPPAGGGDPETLPVAAARALDAIETPQRAVTLSDTETLAKRTPGARVARAIALANVHPAFACMRAPGIVTVIIIPHLPVARPSPSPGLCRLVAAWLAPRRIVGTRIVVAPPQYVEVTVRVRVRARPRTAASAVADIVRRALDDFLDPLRGGPDGLGWPLGRDVYRTEVMAVIDRVAGVDHIVDLRLIGNGSVSCGNLCVPPTGLVAAGAHEIEVR